MVRILVTLPRPDAGTATVAGFEVISEVPRAPDDQPHQSVRGGRRAAEARRQHRSRFPPCALSGALQICDLLAVAAPELSELAGEHGNDTRRSRLAGIKPGFRKLFR
jgi:hypothetical protein